MPNALSYLDDRFEEITKKKNSQLNFLPHVSQVQDTPNGDFLGWLHEKQNLNAGTYKEPKLNFTEENEEEYRDSIDYDWQPDAGKIHKALCHIIVCNLNFDLKNFSLKQWVKAYMVKVYKRLFDAENALFDNLFRQWAEFSIQFTLDSFSIEGVPDAILEDVDVFYSRIAQALMDELGEFEGTNKYIDAYCSVLARYVIE